MIEAYSTPTFVPELVTVAPNNFKRPLPPILVLVLLVPPCVVMVPALLSVSVAFK